MEYAELAHKIIHSIHEYERVSGSPVVQIVLNKETALTHIAGIPVIVENESPHDVMLLDQNAVDLKKRIGLYEHR